MNDRLHQIARMIPKNVESILDIGCKDKFFKRFGKKYTGIDLKGAEINQDLNKNQKLKLKDGSYDLIIFSQILEHIADPRQLISEAKRVSKKCIIVGLPTELTLDNRFRFFFGKISGEAWGGFNIYGHKHFFTVDTIEKFILEIFGKYSQKYYIFGVKGGRFLPLKIRLFLAKTFPKLFAKEIYYLIEKPNFSKEF